MPRLLTLWLDFGVATTHAMEGFCLNSASVDYIYVTFSKGFCRKICTNINTCYIL